MEVRSAPARALRLRVETLSLSLVFERALPAAHSSGVHLESVVGTSLFRNGSVHIVLSECSVFRVEVSCNVRHGGHEGPATHKIRRRHVFLHDVVAIALVWRLSIVSLCTLSPKMFCPGYSQARRRLARCSPRPWRRRCSKVRASRCRPTSGRIERWIGLGFWV